MIALDIVRHRLASSWLRGIALVLTLLFAGCGSSTTASASAGTSSTATIVTNQKPVTVTVFAPGVNDQAGLGGIGWVVDLALDATTSADNSYLSAANGYKPMFNTPGTATFHPGPDPAAPGLVVLISTTQNMAGTPFQGPGTNLAGLFQINTVGMVNNGTIAEIWNTWQAGKPNFGTSGPTTLTVFVVSGTAPAVITGDPEQQPNLISNIVRVNFEFAPAAQQ